MKINRNELLNTLMAVQPGLDSKGLIQQSQDFVFLEGEVITYNGQVSVSAITDIDFDFSVGAKKLIDFLKKLKDEELEIELVDGEVQFTGVQTAAGLKIREDVLTPFESVDQIGDFEELPEHFWDAVKVCCSCAADSHQRPQLTCVCLNGDRMVATDGFRLCTYQFEEDCLPETLIPASEARIIAKYEPLEFSLTDNWIHFRTEGDVYLSVRIMDEPYPPTDAILRVNGTEFEFPENVVESLKLADVFTGPGSLKIGVEVSLSKDQMAVKASDSDGWVKKKLKFDYDGPEVSFLINNDFLQDGLGFLHTGIISEDNNRLLLKGDSLKYVIMCMQKDDS